MNPLWVQHADYLHHGPYAAFFGFGGLYFLVQYLGNERRRGLLLASGVFLFPLPVVVRLLVLHSPVVRRGDDRPLPGADQTRAWHSQWSRRVRGTRHAGQVGNERLGTRRRRSADWGSAFPVDRTGDGPGRQLRVGQLADDGRSTRAMLHAAPLSGDAVWLLVPFLRRRMPAL